jgi:hypothetical protein
MAGTVIKNQSEK